VTTTTIEHLREPADVQAFARDARNEGRLALDTEFVWERTYSPVPCLLQLATAERLAVLDPLEDVDVGPIAELVADPAVQLVMHAPAGDLLLFATRYGVRATNVFDTQLAAGFVGHGISMAYDRLVERALSVTLTHNETFSDWSRRPLTEAQIAYAADDVHYLFALADALIERLEQMGRRPWAEDEIARRYGPGATIEPDPQRAYLKVARRGRLSGRQLAALRAVAAWREEEARARDLPPGWVLKDPSVVEVARRNPQDAAALGRLRGLGNLSASASQRLLETLARAAQAEPPPAPRELPPGLARRVAAASALGAVLVRARCEGAHIAPELVATRAELESFVEAMATGVDGHALLTGWRRELVGAELEQLVRGNVALALDPQAPYVRTLPLPPL
jgi:ribonuclease D